MEARGLKMAMVLVAVMMVIGFWVTGPSGFLAEGAFGIQLNPCTLPQCVSECRKALQEKYQSATCANGSQGKLCICLG